VRQPLAEVAFAVRNAEEASALEKYADLLEDELNVKQVRALVPPARRFLTASIRCPSSWAKIRQPLPGHPPGAAGAGAEPAALQLLQGRALRLLCWREYEILPEEVEVRAQARSGYAVASEGAYLAPWSPT
jgi:isoleucyl-tRNA synthetase